MEEVSQKQNKKQETNSVRYEENGMLVFVVFFFPPNLLLPSSENEDGGEGHTAYEGQKAHATSSPRPPQCRQTSEMQMTNRREPAEVHSCLFPFFSLACKRRALENSLFCQGPVERPPDKGL